MDPTLTASVLTGAFALGGSLSGVLVTGYLTRRAERERIGVEDRRRWVAEWRHAYADYIGIARSIFDDLMAAGNYLEPEVAKEAAQELGLRADRIVERWHTELQSALGEVTLIATPEVVDFAARLAEGLLYLIAVLVDDQSKSTFESWTDRCGELLEALVNRMRSELGAVMFADLPSSSLLDGLGRDRRVKAKPLRGRFASLDTAVTAKGRQLRGGRERRRALGAVRAASPGRRVIAGPLAGH
jgi:hypothetical protein